jgi:O-antigen ligase
MKTVNTEQGRGRKAVRGILAADLEGSRWVWAAFWALLLLATLCVTAPWAGFHAVLLGCVGVLMWLCPPVVSLPRLWWVLAAMFILAGSAAFLPAGWFMQPAWRGNLEALGVQTGSRVVIESRQAAEAFALFGILLITGLWLAGQRASASQLRFWALAFTLGVAAYAVLSRILQDAPHAGCLTKDAHFGFFPNRNHTATYLAMGAICGLGNVLQTLRDKRFWAMGLALAGTGICMWALGAWSVSRGGVVLLGCGCLAWLPMLGRHYLGKHGLWALGLIGLTVIGLFFIAESHVKNRLSLSVEKTGLWIDPPNAVAPGAAKPALESTQDLDFRIPIALDTFGLIRDFPWTGIGAGEYGAVFPQYRNRSSVANNSDSLHPESDWLWMAAELGIPATLALVALVVLAFSKSGPAIRNGRERALRSACWVAALLVPIHGFFDVPGHRITLAWSAVFLFALSLHAPPADASRVPPKAWPFRLVALVLLLVSAFLIRAQWGGGPQPAFIAADTAFDEAKRLYQEDSSMQKATMTKGETYQPDSAADPLEQALRVLDQAHVKAPLQRPLYRYEGFLALHFDDKNELAQRAFAIERALDPTWVNAPLEQAKAWLPIDAQQAAALWEEAFQRAGRLDQLRSGQPSSVEQTRGAILRQVRGNPALERLWQERFADKP